jgi:hypothetical protein
MTRAVIERLQAVLAAGSGQSGVFSKIGDSITADPNFLDCFARSDVDLDQYGALEPARAFFAATVVDGTHSSFDRTSLAATVGWTAAKALAGSPSPIDQEVVAISPALAVVMFGTNETDPCCVASFERNLTGVVDALLGHSVVPLLSSIPPRGDSTANALVPEMNAVVRVVAQRRQVPYMDLWQRLIGLNRYGLAPDGVHPQSYVSAGAHSCWLTPEGLTEGMNQRNLLTLQALARARDFLEESTPAEDAPPALDGAGTWEAPRVVDASPSSTSATPRRAPPRWSMSTAARRRMKAGRRSFTRYGSRRRRRCARASWRTPASTSTSCGSTRRRRARAFSAPTMCSTSRRSPAPIIWRSTASSPPGSPRPGRTASPWSSCSAQVRTRRISTIIQAKQTN